MVQLYIELRKLSRIKVSQEVQNGYICFAGGTDVCHRVMNIPLDGYTIIYVLDIVRYTAFQYPEFYTWIPSRGSLYSSHSVLLIPLGRNPLFFLFHAREVRLSFQGTVSPICTRS